MKALRLPKRVSVVTYLFRFHCPRLPPSSCSPQRSRKLRGCLAGPGLVAGCPSFRFLSRGRAWDLSGLQAILPVPLLRSKTPVEPRCPRQSRTPRCCPRYPYSEGLGDTLISGLTRSFSTRYRTLHAWRCRTRARLASGRRAAPLPGGIRTLWIATKGFSSFDDHPPFLLS